MNFGQEEIVQFEKDGEILVIINEKNIILIIDDVLISLQDIEGWLVVNVDGIIVVLDVIIMFKLKKEGIVRELVN